jgi:hypothetical protein
MLEPELPALVATMPTEGLPEPPALAIVAALPAPARPLPAIATALPPAVSELIDALLLLQPSFAMHSHDAMQAMTADPRETPLLILIVTLHGSNRSRWLL